MSQPLNRLGDMATPSTDPVPRRMRRVSDERRPTSTSSFGVGRREAHDASDFYARFTPPQISDDSTVNPFGVVDEVYCLDARQMDEGKERLQPDSVALMVTSPPYFAGKEYERELGQGHIPGDYLEYLQMLHDVFARCVEKLEPGGRIAVNVANLGRKPWRSLSADVIRILQDDLGLLLRGEIIWQKGRGASGSCAWGSFQSPANPVLRDLTERVVVASKGRFDRAVSRIDRARRGLPATATISKDEFMEATLDIWDIPPESATRVGHPAPFPVELPQRLIELYTYQGDLVLDPFMGSGSTAVAAVRTGRHFVGFDTDRSYVQQAKQRVEEEHRRLAAGPSRREVAVPAGAQPEPTSAAEAAELGEQARLVAEALLRDAGFDPVVAPTRPVHGVDLSLVATDRSGGTWYVEVVGGLGTPGPGLRSLDAVWRVIGKATLLDGADPSARGVIVLTTVLPQARSRGDQALRRAAPLIPAVLDLLGPETPTELRALARSS